VNGIAIKIHDEDSVAVVANDGGLPAGTEVLQGIVLLEDIPQGHKLALTDLNKGDSIIRYGEIIGTAVEFLPRGSWVKEQHISLPVPPLLADIPIATSSRVVHDSPGRDYTFQGFRNEDGSVGTRNILGVMTSVQCVAGVAEHAAREITRKLLPAFPRVDGVVAINHAYGCGVAIQAPDALIPIRSLQNIMSNPNFGGESLVIGLGCEKLQPQTLISANTSLNNDTISLQDCDGFQAMINKIMGVAEEKLERLDRRRRETCPVSDLVIGVQCGGSDAFSGITANPSVGYATDMIVRGGGTVLFSEVSEVRDAVHLLLPRAVSREVGEALISEMEWYDNYLESAQVDRSANPTPGNKMGGLSNIVEKSLGSIIKSGHSPIADVLGHGEKVRKKGLVFAATPANDFVCGTQQLASGMTLQVFTTGRGTPYNLSMAPVIKVSSRTALSKRWFDLIDLDAGRIATGDATIEDIGLELFEMILSVASGKTTTAADKLGLINDLVVFNPAPIT
jgi:galactarate dehydratase